MKTITVDIPDDCEIQIVKKNRKIKKYQDLIDNEIELQGCYIGVDSDIINEDIEASEYTKNIASTKEIAKSMLAMAMISQLMPYYGGEVTTEEWKNKNYKYCIERDVINNIIISICRQSIYNFLAFHTPEQRDAFLKYNKQLVEDYLMID